LSYYEAKPPFARLEQLRTHKKAIDLRRQLGTASAALADDRYLDSLAALPARFSEKKDEPKSQNPHDDDFSLVRPHTTCD